MPDIVSLVSELNGQITTRRLPTVLPVAQPKLPIVVFPPALYCPSVEDGAAVGVSGFRRVSGSGGFRVPEG
jgi:hypothetical protein